jgi:septum formation protein
MLRQLQTYNIILASQSPRRQYLLKELGLDFEIRNADVEEIFPDSAKREEIPLFLSELKAKAFDGKLQKNDLLITADTIVWIENKVLNKPHTYEEASAMLNILSGKMHEVITGVCIKTVLQTKIFYCVTRVFFKKLSPAEIDFYITNFKPFDKAGSYGAQEWIGYTGIEKIEGSYFNVMGLPTKELHEELLKF